MIRSREYTKRPFTDNTLYTAAYKQCATEHLRFPPSTGRQSASVHPRGWNAVDTVLALPLQPDTGLWEQTQMFHDWKLLMTKTNCDSNNHRCLIFLSLY